MTPSSPQTSTNPWPYRWAFATWLAAIPLLLFGGTITTLDAGMSIDGWWILEPGRGDHFLLFYPIEKWFRDLGTFSEHTHRLFGILVGNLAIVTVIATWWKDSRKSARFSALAALSAVCLQGWLGGSRVLESSPQLAFLHGALAQIVFAILAWNAIYLSPRFSASDKNQGAESATLRNLGVLAILGTYATIFAGTWLRHAFSHGALGVHILLVIGATLLVFLFAAKLKAASTNDPTKAHLRSAARRLHALLGLQILLGIASFWVIVMVTENLAPDVHHSVYPTLHVLFGALIFSQVVVATLWSRRACTSDRGRHPELEAAAMEASA